MNLLVFYFVFYYYIWVKERRGFLFIQRNPKEVAEDFYFSTFIPVSAYLHGGHKIYEAGDQHLFGDDTLLDNLMKKMTTSHHDNYSSITLSSDEGFHYTAYNINKTKPEDGFVLIGPYEEEDLERMNRHDLCYLNNLYLAPRNKVTTLCPQNGCAHCYSLNIRRALNFIEAHYSESVTLDKVISHLDLNKSYFCTLFKKETGKTFTHYLNEIRVERSKRQLLKDNRSILDVALSVGFTSQNYFAITFKKHTEMTPMEFRRKAFG